MKDKKWYELSQNVKVQCVTNWLQDSILLIEVGKRLFINLNDAGCRYYEKYIRKITENYKNSYLLSLSGWGDADMINFFLKMVQELQNQQKTPYHRANN